MKPYTTLDTIAGVKVLWNGEDMMFTAGAMVNADGSPRAYAPNNKGLDYIANAGSPGNWWGIETHNMKKSGTPVIQDGASPAQPHKGFYISTTAKIRSQYGPKDVRRYIDSETVPHVTLPPRVIKAVPPVFLGCRCLLMNLKNGMECEAVLADIGPNNKIGEISIAAAKELGLNPDPKRGGTSEKIVEYHIFPGVPATVNGETFALQPS